jgi:hypothetical protein
MAFARRRRRWLAALNMALGLIAIPSAFGCVGPGNRQTLRFDVAPGAVGTQVTERHWYFLWGLVPTAQTDVRRKCPTGVVAIREEPGEMGALAWLPTLGLSSRSTTYLCRATADGVSP